MLSLITLNKSNYQERPPMSETEPALSLPLSSLNPDKPLGRKAYGSIPHLPGSRMGPGDHHCHAGQETICLKKTRDKHDRVICSEKLDGSNVAVANVNGEIIAVGRAGYLASQSPYLQHKYFAIWVGMNYDRFEAILKPGERLNGEWLALAHGTRYNLPHEPFVAFDLMVEDKRLPFNEVVARCQSAGITMPRVLSDNGPISVEKVLTMIETSGHGALEAVEGAVWRVERQGKFDFIAKWVRPDKVDGKYLTDITGAAEIWHWRPWN